MKALSSFFFFLSIAALSARASIQPYPSSFSVQEIRANGATLHVRVGGTGPAVVLLHGFADTGVDGYINPRDSGERRGLATGAAAVD
jgi:hypothetical protein